MKMVLPMVSARNDDAHTMTRLSQCKLSKLKLQWNEMVGRSPLGFDSSPHRGFSAYFKLEGCPEWSKI